MKLSRLLLSLSFAAALTAHPMGQSSVSHYTRITVDSHGADLLYILDLAETRAAELLHDWKLNWTSPREQLESKASEQAQSWTRNLRVTVDGRSVVPQFVSADLAIAEGVRIAARLRLPVSAGKLEFDDG